MTMQKQFRTLRGTLGLMSPKFPEPTITIQHGVFSRTGLTYGNVDEARGVRITAWGELDENGRDPLRTETLFGREYHDAAARNRIGTLGAFVTPPLTSEEIDAAVERARTHLENNLPAIPAIRTTVRGAH